MNEQLKVAGHGLMNAARRELEKTGGLRPTLGVQLADGKVIFYPLTDDRLAELMNRGDAKDFIFGYFRALIAREHCIGFLALTEAWVGVSTPKGAAMDREEFERITKERGFETALARGLVERSEAIIVTIQTAEEVLLLTQPFERFSKIKLVTFGTQTEATIPQAGFRGREKMFGDLRAENLS